MGVKSIYILSNTHIEGAKKLPLIRQHFYDVDIELCKYDYLIFSSKNGVRALDRLTSAWKNLPSLAIGKATASQIIKTGGKVAFVASKFYAKEFAKEIANRFDKQKRYLFIRGKKILFDTGAYLRSQGFLIEEKILYETVCNSDESLQKPPKGSIIIFSSPSTIECFIRRFSWDESYKAIAIGKKTASHLPSCIQYSLCEGRTLQECVDALLHK